MTKNEVNVKKISHRKFTTLGTAPVVRCLSVTVCPTPPRENGGWVVAQYVHGRWSTYQQLDRIRPAAWCCWRNRSPLRHRDRESEREQDGCGAKMTET